MYDEAPWLLLGSVSGSNSGCSTAHRRTPPASPVLAGPGVPRLPEGSAQAPARHQAGPRCWLLLVLPPPLSAPEETEPGTYSAGAGLAVTSFAVTAQQIILSGCGYAKGWPQG